MGFVSYSPLALDGPGKGSPGTLSLSKIEKEKGSRSDQGWEEAAFNSFPHVLRSFNKTDGLRT